MKVTLLLNNMKPGTNSKLKGQTSRIKLTNLQVFCKFHIVIY